MNFKRTILIGIVLCSFSAQTIVVKNKPQPAETYKDIILKSKNLTLQNDRMQALNILSTSITKETPKSLAQFELKKTFREISSIFLSDRAQQLYELSISMKRSDIQAAMNQLLDAQRLEPDNFLIMTELVRLQINKGDCGAAIKELAKYGKFKSVSEELILINLQTTTCLSDQKSIDENKALAVNIKSPDLLVYWKSVDLELAKGEVKKMHQLIEELAKIDAQYPELEYWRWKLDILNKKSASIAGDKYLILCKNLSSSKFRQYMLDPNLCKRVKDVEKSEN